LVRFAAPLPTPRGAMPTPPDPAGLSLARAAELVGGRVVGESTARFLGIAPLEEAGEVHLGFLADSRYLKQVAGSRAGALLVAAELEERLPIAAWRGIVTDAPHQALVRLLEELHPSPDPPPGIHPTAVLGRGVVLGERVHVGPYAVLEEGVEVGDNCRIGAHVVVGAGARMGAGCVLHPQVVLYPDTVLGDRVILHAGVRVGVDGFGYVFHEGSHRKVPQVGGCVLEDDVEVGANSTVDRGSIGRTVVGRGSKLDNLVHLGHNVHLGELGLVVAQVGVAGSTRLGKGVVLGGQAGVGGHLRVGDGARVAARGGVIGDVQPGETVSGFPARPHKEFMRAMAALQRLPDLQRRVAELERALAAGGSHGPDEGPR